MKKILFLLFFICNRVFCSNIYFPAHQLSVGFANQSILPWQFPALPKPLFWNSRYSAHKGVMLQYAYTRYHTRAHFSVNLGLSTAWWQAHTQNLMTLSFLFELRWWLFRTKWFNPYLFYSIAGPTLLSRAQFAGSKLGGYFLFQDYLGAGVLLGNSQQINLEAKIVHYSNGDLAVYNKGLQIPFVLSLGFSL